VPSEGKPQKRKTVSYTVTYHREERHDEVEGGLSPLIYAVTDPRKSEKSAMEMGGENKSGEKDNGLRRGRGGKIGVTVLGEEEFEHT